MIDAMVRKLDEMQGTEPNLCHVTWWDIRQILNAGKEEQPKENRAIYRQEYDFMREQMATLQKRINEVDLIKKAWKEAIGSGQERLRCDVKELERRVALQELAITKLFVQLHNQESPVVGVNKHPELHKPCGAYPCECKPSPAVECVHDIENIYGGTNRCRHCKKTILEIRGEVKPDEPKCEYHKGYGVECDEYCKSPPTR